MLLLYFRNLSAHAKGLSELSDYYIIIIIITLYILLLGNVSLNEHAAVQHIVSNNNIITLEYCLVY